MRHRRCDGRSAFLPRSLNLARPEMRVPLRLASSRNLLAGAKPRGGGPISETGLRHLPLANYLAPVPLKQAATGEAWCSSAPPD
jgi:hypothetical protein